MLHPKNRKLTILATATGLVAVGVSLGLWMLASRGGQVDTSSDPGAPSTVLASTTRASPIAVSGMDPADALLDPARQKYIWDTEHITHLMEWRFGTKFRAALVARDKRQLIEFFRSPFQGLVLNLQQSHVHTKGPVSRRTYSVGSPPQRVDAVKLVTWLIDVLSEFASIDSTSLRVLQISQAGEQNNAWVMQLLVTARGTSDTGTLLALDSTHRVRCLWTDEDEIGSGRIIVEWNVEACSLRSCPRRLMEEVTDRTGLSRVPLADNWKLTDKVPLKLRFQMAVEDFDRDGYLDIALSDVNGRMILLHSERGQRFVEATRSLGLPPVRRRRHSSFSLGWIDYDNDGFPDLLMGGRIYHNQDGRRFQDVTEQSGLRFEPKQMGFIVADYDLDGRLDLYFMYANSLQRKAVGPTGWIGDDRTGAENRLWRNLGDGRFRDVTDEANAAGGHKHTLAATWLFADEDHYPDLYVANDFGTNVLLQNRGDGTFSDISFASGTSDYATSMGVASGDLDNDGLPEIYVANMYSKMGRRIIGQVGPDDYPPGVYEQIKGACAGNRLYAIQRGQQRYHECGEQLGISSIGWAYAPTMIDYDNDGRLDLYATTGFMSFDRRKPDG